VDFEPILYPWWDGMVPERRLWEGPRDPFAHFIRWTFEYRAYLPMLCGLACDSAVVELGCSHGRTMLALTDYLKPPGRYEGLDINAEKIAFAQQHIHSAYPHCNFTFADVYSAMYNPSLEAVPAEQYRFPYADETFDVAFAASLFTHLQPPAVANYFKETRRTMKRGGKCLFSFFLIDYYRGPGTSSWPGYEFNHLLQGFDGVAVREPEMPEKLIAYKTAAVKQMALDAGFSMVLQLPGDWSRSARVIVNEQDLVILEAI
jgi:SAM-dependent methyltransferase